MDASGGWTLSPAYDLTYSDGPGGEHSAAIAGERRIQAGSICSRWRKLRRSWSGRPCRSLRRCAPPLINGRDMRMELA
ncbi:hypothetical protein [Pararhizobium sp. PWRC1-1]|uniref:hypothetical protein n=1 Tax=Pararhizobium sp. PWRC1-1 TaxID=2804566 RepID=UPI003CF69CF0